MPATSVGGGRTVTAVLTANVQGFIAGMQRAQASAQTLTAELGKASQTQPWQQVSTDLLKVGAAATATVAVVAKAAMGWESAFAGVEKTVDGTVQQLAGLEDELRGMARSMPEAHSGIASVAEAAGQLGVATRDVAGFTEVMVQLGETTNLTADGAATQIAQFTNIMGTSQSGVDRLGATLVQLGNNGASTEAEILALGQRLAGVGAQMHMTEADVLAVANAMASVGIEAEAGGTAMTMTLKGIDAAVRAGGRELETYAATAGMTAQQFAQAWGADAASATASFVEGLAAIAASGGDVNGVLDELGINGARQADTLIRLAGAGDILRDSLEMGADAWSRNTALSDEYAKRLETAESQIQIAWNNIKDAAITAGESTLPAISGIAGAVSGAAQAFAALPPQVHAAGVGLTAFVGVGALTAGGIMKAVTAVAEFQTAMKLMPTWVGGATSALTRFAAAAAGAAAGVELISVFTRQQQTGWDAAKLSVDGYTAALGRLGGAGDITAISDSMSAAMRGSVTGADTLSVAFASLRVSGGGFLEWAETATSHLFDMTGTLEASRAELAKMDTALAGMDSSTAAAAFREIEVQSRLAGDSTSDLIRYFPEYRAALESTAASMGVYGLSTQEMVDWMLGTPPAAVETAAALAALGIAHVDAAASAEQQASALEFLISTQLSLGSAMLAASNAEIAYGSALAAAAEAAERLAGAQGQGVEQFDLYTEAGRTAQQALNNLAGASLQVIDNMVQQGDSANEIAAKTATMRDEFIAAAEQMGLTGEAAQGLADQVGLIPTEVVVNVSAPGVDDATAKTVAFFEATETLPRDIQTAVRTSWLRDEFDAALAVLAAENGRQYTNYLRTVVSSPVADPGNFYAGGGNEWSGGGTVRGPGTSTSDDILSWLSDGEFVTRTWAAERIGYDNMAYMNATGELPRFVGGGAVRAAPPPAGWGSVASQPAAVMDGRPRPVEITTQLVLDGRVIAEAVRRHDRALV